MLKRISVLDLRVGMHIQELCGSWMEHPFWRTSFVIRDDGEIQRIAASGIREVWIDATKGLDVPGKTKEEVSNATDAMLAGVAVCETEPGRISIEEELRLAARICARSRKAVVSMFQEVRMGKAISAEQAGAVVEEISSSVLRNPGALISLARLKRADDYTYMHSVAVCALMVAVARQLGFPDTQIREAGMAGLLHDLGKAMMPNEILTKPARLTDDEFNVMKSHPLVGHRLLVDGNIASDVVLDVCLHHHEKMDGSGYPHQRHEEQIGVFARMAAVCDVYDAVTSVRPYKNGWDPAGSIRKMAEWCDGHFDGGVFRAFVKAIGIYPVGSLVRLRSGRLGVVVDQTDRSLLTPKVKVFFSTKSNLRIPPEVVDLSGPAARDSIVSIEDSVNWNFGDLSHLWNCTQ